MAVSLSRAQKSAKKAIKPTSKKEAARPWTKPRPTADQPRKPSTWPPLANDPMVSFDNHADLRLLPEDIETATSRQLVGMFAKRFLHSKWREMQRKSYWLSRVTHKNSWWARIRFYPELKVPLPSWLTQKRDLDAR